jgi:hypothetical protein
MPHGQNSYIRFQLPDGRSFKQFDMPAVPVVGDQLHFVNGPKDFNWAVEARLFVLNETANQTEVTVFLKEIRKKQ